MTFIMNKINTSAKSLPHFPVKHFLLREKSEITNNQLNQQQRKITCNVRYSCFMRNFENSIWFSIRCIIGHLSTLTHNFYAPFLNHDSHFHFSLHCFFVDCVCMRSMYICLCLFVCAYVCVYALVSEYLYAGYLCVRVC